MVFIEIDHFDGNLDRHTCLINPMHVAAVEVHLRGGTKLRMANGADYWLPETSPKEAALLLNSEK